MELSGCSLLVIVPVTALVLSGIGYSLYQGYWKFVETIRNPAIDWTTSILSLLLVVGLGYLAATNVSIVSCTGDTVASSKPMQQVASVTPCACGCGRHRTP